jgi:hypothetical protein
LGHLPQILRYSYTPNSSWGTADRAASRQIAALDRRSQLMTDFPKQALAGLTSKRIDAGSAEFR